MVGGKWKQGDIQRQLLSPTLSHDGGLDENDSNEDGMRVDGFEIYFEDRATKLTDGFRK